MREPPVAEHAVAEAIPSAARTIQREPRIPVATYALAAAIPSAP